MLTNPFCSSHANIREWNLTREQSQQNLREHHSRYVGQIAGGAAKVVISTATHEASRTAH